MDGEWRCLARLGVSTDQHATRAFLAAPKRVEYRSKCDTLHASPANGARGRCSVEKGHTDPAHRALDSW